MPVDFNRVPPRVDVPPPPQPTMLVWVTLLVLVMGAGAALTIMLWPADRSTKTLWFWVCAAGYPVLAWASMLFSWLGYGYARRNGAIATNRVSDEAEQSCHAAASRPLAILGQVWCFSSNDAENTLEGIRDGSVQAQPRPSAAIADSEVNARWFEIPDEPFHPGNEQGEHARHQVVCRWLLQRMLDRLASQLRALPLGTTLRVELQLRSKLKFTAVQTHLRELLVEKVPALKVDVLSDEQAVPLFRTDAWLDGRSHDSAYLLVAIELLDAISNVLSDGVAEVGVALLAGPPRFAQGARPSALRLHRPAKGALDTVAGTLDLATRWGQSSIERSRAVWTHGLTGERASAVRKAAQFAEQTKWMPLETSIGNCSGAGPWLAVALAAENAHATGEPQLVLSHEDGDLVALVCRKQT